MKIRICHILRGICLTEGENRECVRLAWRSIDVLLLISVFLILPLDKLTAQQVSAQKTPATAEMVAAESVTTESHSGEITAGPELRVRLADGAVKRSWFVQNTYRLSDDLRLTSGVTVDFANGSYQTQGTSPVRIVTLWTGEVIPTPMNIPPAGHPVMATLYSESLMPPMLAIGRPFASIRQPISCKDTCPADPQFRPEATWRVAVGNQQSLPDTAGTTDNGETDIPDPDATESWGWRRVDITPTVSEGLIILSGQWPVLKKSIARRPRPGSTSDESGKEGEADSVHGTIRFVFRDDGGATQSLSVSRRDHTLRVVLPDGRSIQADPVSPHLKIQMRLGHSLTISSHNTMLARMTRPPGELIAIEAGGRLLQAVPFAPPVPEGRLSKPLRWLREPLVRRVDRSLNQSAAFRQRMLRSIWHADNQDRVVLNSGDEIFGVLTEANRAVEIHDPVDRSHIRRLDRSIVQAVCFSRPEILRTNRIKGMIARIDLVPDVSCSLAGLEEPFWIRTAIVSAERHEMRTRHSLLGTVMIRWPMIRRITPLFEGTYRLLKAGPFHLGNAYRDDLCRTAPDGSELSMTFAMEQQELKLPTYLSVDASELIPSGPDTLKATPFLEDVRAGFLTTQVRLNGEPVAKLNDLIHIRSPATAPERLRLHLPERLLLAGENTVTLHQTSARNDANSFDDCELRSLAIETEHPVDRAEESNQHPE